MNIPNLPVKMIGSPNNRGAVIIIVSLFIALAIAATHKNQQSTPTKTNG